MPVVPLAMIFVGILIGLMDVRNRTAGKADKLQEELDEIKAKLADATTTASEATALQAEAAALRTELAGLKSGSEARNKDAKDAPPVDPPSDPPAKNPFMD